MIPRRDDPISTPDVPPGRRARVGAVLGVVVTVAALVAAVIFAWPEGVSARRMIDDVVQLQAGDDAPALATLRGASIPSVPFTRRATAAGWRPVAMTTQRVHDRDAISVVWEKSGRRLVYTRLSGAAVGRPEGSGRTGRSQVLLYSLPGDLRSAVTWTEDGRTAVISGADISTGDLYDLAGGPARR